MQNIFVINPAVSYPDLIDVINRKLDQAQSIADCLALSEPSGVVVGTISDLLDEIKQLIELLCKKFNPA